MDQTLGRLQQTSLQAADQMREQLVRQVDAGLKEALGGGGGLARAIGEAVAAQVGANGVAGRHGAAPSPRGRAMQTPEQR